MAREFTFGSDTLTLANAAVTVAFLNPKAAPNMNIEFLRMWLSQQASATSAMQTVQVVTQPTSFPTLVSVTPRALKHGDATASIIAGNTTGAAGTCGVNASAEGAGAKTVKFGDNFNVLNGFLWVPTPRETIVMPCGSTSGLGLYLPIAASTLSGWAVGMVYGEV